MAMQLRVGVPFRRLSLAYDAARQIATIERRRTSGFVVLEALDTPIRVIFRPLAPALLPARVDGCLAADLDGLCSEFGPIEVLTHRGDQDVERSAWTGERDGARIIARNGDSDTAWMMFARGPRGSAVELLDELGDLAASVRREQGRKVPWVLEATVHGGVDGRSIIADLATRPFAIDTHLHELRIVPDPERPALVKLLQGPQLAMFTRVLVDGVTRAGTCAVPARASVIVQLPRIELPCAPTAHAHVLLNGHSPADEPVHAIAGLASLAPVLSMRAPVGPQWSRLHGPDEVSIHRLSASLDDGELTCAERGAYDFDLPMFGDSDSLDAYPAFGQPIHAPCSGKVVYVDDHLPDQLPGVRDLQHPRGNEIRLRRDDGLIVVLAHLQQHSAVVRVGQRVEAGQRLAAVGNTGDSAAPHLHVHVADTGAPLANGRIVRWMD